MSLSPEARTLPERILALVQDDTRIAEARAIARRVESIEQQLHEALRLLGEQKVRQ